MSGLSQKRSSRRDDQLQGLLGLSAKHAARFGQVVVARLVAETDHQIIQDGHIVSCMAHGEAGGIFL